MGSESNIAELAEMMLRLQEIGCHNTNLVTPTHYSAPIVKALDMAVETGLRLPIVYNTSGWERLEILKLLDGIVDIYLPDFKYWDSDMPAKYSSGAESYPETTREAILETHRQVGVVKPAKDGNGLNFFSPIPNLVRVRIRTLISFAAHRANFCESPISWRYVDGYQIIPPQVQNYDHLPR